MTKPNITAVVSGPAKCLINIWPFFCRFKNNFTWKIVYLTHDTGDQRLIEMSKFWMHYPVTLDFLLQEHNESDEEDFTLSFDREVATEKIVDACADADLLLSHNHLGEWGHVHHVFVNSVVEQIDKPKVYFGYQNDNDNNLIIPPKEYGNAKIDTSQLHWTKEWIDKRGQSYTGQYFCDNAAKKLLNSNANITFTR